MSMVLFVGRTLRVSPLAKGGPFAVALLIACLLRRNGLIAECWIDDLYAQVNSRRRCSNAAQQIVGRERRERVSHHDWSGDA
jgi:hypothetical protein